MHATLLEKPTAPLCPPCYNSIIFLSSHIPKRISSRAYSIATHQDIRTTMRDQITHGDIKLLIVFCPLLCILWVLPERFVEKVYLKK
jgi:hypothetical protein